VQLTREIEVGSADALTGIVMKRFSWPLAVVFLTCSSVGAQRQAPVRLSLAQAVERALAQNPEMQVANLQIAASQQDRKIARSALLPQASVNAGDTIRRINVETLIGHQIPAFGQVSGPFQAVTAGAAFSMPIFDLHLWKQYRAAKDRVGTSRADAQTRREQTSLLVVSQYLGVLRAMVSVDASKSRVGLARALLDQAKALHQAGVATRVDEVRAEVKVRQEEQALIVTQTDMQTALFALARLLNIPPNQEIKLTDTGSFSETAEIPPDATIEAAIRNRPELAAAEFRKRTAESERSAAAAESLPSLRFKGVWDEAGRNLPEMIPTHTYDEVWPILQQWLNEEPHATAKGLFRRLNTEMPNRFKPGQYRTLQRRVKDWRTAIARRLVPGCNYDVDSDQYPAESMPTGSLKEEIIA
jgi:outer membrane protein TolC